MPSYDSELNKLVGELNRQAPSRAQAAPSPEPTRRSEDRLEQSELANVLREAIGANASDVLLIPGTRIVHRVNGRIVTAGDAALSEADVRGMVLPLLNQREYARLQSERALDVAFQSSAGRRFRANIHHQRDSLAATIRILPRDVPKLGALGLPAATGQFAALRRGLVLITGPTGSGKSSTLAALVDEINSTRECHIVTIEDPIEFVHENRRSVIEQIEVGIDTPSFSDSLRSVLRQSPDVILVGEMRDPETISLALSAAETGHLVLSTLHTNDVAQSISRIVDSVPAGNQPQTRQQLSLALAAILNQQLVVATDGARRLPACELLIASDAIRHLIRQGQDHQIRSQLLLSRSKGMATMEQSLATLVLRGQISMETALSHSFRPDELRTQLSQGGV